MVIYNDDDNCVGVAHARGCAKKPRWMSRGSCSNRMKMRSERQIVKLICRIKYLIVAYCVYDKHDCVMLHTKVCTPPLGANFVSFFLLLSFLAAKFTFNIICPVLNSAFAGTLYQTYQLLILFRDNCNGYSIAYHTLRK